MFSEMPSGAPALDFDALRVPFAARQGLEAWPGGRPIALILYIAAEQWRWDDPDEPNRTSLLWSVPGETGQSLSSRTAINFGFEVGLPRLATVLAERGMRATLLTNAISALQYPDVIRDAASRGLEVEGHGVTQGRPLTTLSPEQQAHDIAESSRVLASVVGEPPQFWLGPGAAATEVTVEQLLAQGIPYHGDFQDDDLPYIIRKGDRQLVEIPYRMIGNINDVAFSKATKSPPEFFDHMTSSLDLAIRASKHGPMHFIFGLHAHIAGRHDLAMVVADFLDYASSRDEVWLTTYRSVGQQWTDKFGSERW